MTHQIWINGVGFDLLGRCPCGQLVYASLETQALAHRDPQCPDFDRMEAADYVTWLRRARGIPDSMVEEN